MYKNWKILKSDLADKQEEYSEVAEWCNESGQYHIEDMGEYYAVVHNAEPSAEEIKAARIAALKQLLAGSDYAIIKIAEGSATAADYADLIAERRAWREEINKLEG